MMLGTTNIKFKRNVTFFSGYINKATTLEIRKFSDKLNYLNFPFVKFFNKCTAGGFDVNYTFYIIYSRMCLKVKKYIYSCQWEINFFICIWLHTEVRTGCLSSENALQYHLSVNHKMSSLFKLCHFEYGVQFDNRDECVIFAILIKCKIQCIWLPLSVYLATVSITRPHSFDGRSSTNGN